MRSPFETPIGELLVDDVRRFLASADEETITWEGKGDGRSGLRPEHLRKSVCAFANQIGGTLIIGAQRDAEDWNLAGVSKAVDGEPQAWIESVLRDLRPVPAFTTKAFSLGDGRWAAVVEVEAVTESPCMTKDGHIWERVGSESQQVSDPVRIRELIRRGDAARETAQTKASASADRLRLDGISQSDLGVGIAAAVTATNYETDIGTRLFSYDFRAELERLSLSELFVSLNEPEPEGTLATIGQDYMQIEHSSPQTRWRARAAWDGAVVVWLTVPRTRHFDWPVLSLGLIPAWRLAAALVRSLGGYGDARADFRFARSRFGGDAAGDLVKLPYRLAMTRNVDLEAPDESAIASVQREMERASGLWSLER